MPVYPLFNDEVAFKDVLEILILDDEMLSVDDEMLSVDDDELFHFIEEELNYKTSHRIATEANKKDK